MANGTAGSAVPCQLGCPAGGKHGAQEKSIRQGRAPDPAPWGAAPSCMSSPVPSHPHPVPAGERRAPLFMADCKQTPNERKLMT